MGATEPRLRTGSARCFGPLAGGVGYELETNRKTHFDLNRLAVMGAGYKSRPPEGPYGGRIAGGMKRLYNLDLARMSVRIDDKGKNEPALNALSNGRLRVVYVDVIGTEPTHDLGHPMRIIEDAPTGEALRGFRALNLFRRSRLLLRCFRNCVGHKLRFAEPRRAGLGLRLLPLTLEMIDGEALVVRCKVPSHGIEAIFERKMDGDQRDGEAKHKSAHHADYVGVHRRNGRVPSVEQLSST